MLLTFPWRSWCLETKAFHIRGICVLLVLNAMGLFILHQFQGQETLPEYVRLEGPRPALKVARPTRGLRWWYHAKVTTWVTTCLHLLLEHAVQPDLLAGFFRAFCGYKKWSEYIRTILNIWYEHISEHMISSRNDWISYRFWLLITTQDLDPVKYLLSISTSQKSRFWLSCCPGCPGLPLDATKLEANVLENVANHSSIWVSSTSLTLHATETWKHRTSADLISFNCMNHTPLFLSRMHTLPHTKSHNMGRPAMAQQCRLYNYLSQVWAKCAVTCHYEAAGNWAWFPLYSFAFCWWSFKTMNCPLLWSQTALPGSRMNDLNNYTRIL